MHRNRAKSFVWWLLPFLAARALVPAGFMTDVVSGNFKLVMCSEVVKLADTKKDNSVIIESGSKDDSHSISHAPCLFAASATAMLATTHDAVKFNDLHHSHPITAFLVAFAIRDSKVPSIRGPPVFS